ncbi:unnamed protein product [Cuscuta epithymum]|uniref:Transposase (putative) gypsy type domain-containing protein n=1 Tax=Cuscuta epithymum TaxID=186058 RepID=A0AAV0GKX6_9ASTE|nr:unnamed protein product [Cuscuta epithymum]
MSAFSGSSDSEEMVSTLIRHSRGKAHPKDQGTSTRSSGSNGSSASLHPEQPLPDDGCQSGDDLAIYNKGMPERPPRYSLNFHCIRKQRQRLPADAEQTLRQLLPPPRQFYAGYIKHPMRHRPGCVLVHMDALIAGLRFPLHPFIAEFLRRVSVLPAQFVPSTYRILNGFIVWCHELGIAPSADLFLHCYGVQPYWTTGYLRLVARPGRSLFTDNPTPPGKWEERFLFVHVGSPLPFPDRWNTYPVQDASPKVDADIVCQYERLRLAGSKNLRSFLTPAKMLAAGIGMFLPLLCSFGVSFNLLFIFLCSFL